MSGSDSDGVSLSVRAAEKRDAGRGVARIPEIARRQLGVLSGDTVVIEGESTTVAKLWPADSAVPENVVQIDADTRANAGVHVGDTVTVRTKDKSTIREAERVTLRPADALRGSAHRARGDEEAAQPAGQRRRTDPTRGRRSGAVSRRRHRPRRRRSITSATTVRVVDRSGEPADDLVTSARGGDSSDSSTSRSSSASRDGFESEPSSGVTYEDIGGLDEELELVREMIELPLSEPELFQRLASNRHRASCCTARRAPEDADRPRGRQRGRRELRDDLGPEIMSKYKGESEERLRKSSRPPRRTRRRSSSSTRSTPSPASATTTGMPRTGSSVNC